MATGSLLSQSEPPGDHHRVGLHEEQKMEETYPDRGWLMKTWQLGLVVLMVSCAAWGVEPAPMPSSPILQVSLKDILATGKLVDLSHPFNEQTIYWPTEEGFILERGKNGITDKGYYYAANRFR